MQIFGLTIKAKDDLGFHYVNYTIVAKNLEEADSIVVQHYKEIDDDLIEFDQAVELEKIDDYAKQGILEIQGKIYFQDENY